ncbi:hypothetical protein CXB51_010425 [Gossypium anomalum]|uniref:Aminotransferase-like plant mobile domain-containing protein n=1 Tax=Gossypium anomalum TaxID=47600 RepID=A0A8J6D2Z7_9ROSI|nr:hypothetical protein CXB51_010425 [Gossypium anomalum]
MQLQLELSVDEFVLTRSVQSADWGAVYYDLFGAIPDNIYGGRIKIGWLRDTFLEPENDSTEVERTQYARAYILEIIRGYLMLDLSRNLVHLRWLLKLVDFRAARELSWGFAVVATLYQKMYGAAPPNKAKIEGCLSLLQLWAQFRFPFLRLRVSLVNYAIVEMHQTNRVLWQFGFQQSIPVTPEVFDDEQKTDLRQSNTNWSVSFSEYIKIWENRYDYIPTHKPIIVPELACAPDYIPWFRFHNKPYLLLEEQRRPCRKGTTGPFNSNEKG